MMGDHLLVLAVGDPRGHARAATGGAGDDVEAERVEGGGAHPGRGEPGSCEASGEPVGQLGRGGLVERQQQDAIRGDQAAPHCVGGPAHHHRRLAGTGSGDDVHPVVEREHGPGLLLGQRGRLDRVEQVPVLAQGPLGDLCVREVDPVADAVFGQGECVPLDGGQQLPHGDHLVVACLDRWPVPEEVGSGLLGDPRQLSPGVMHGRFDLGSPSDGGVELGVQGRPLVSQLERGAQRATFTSGQTKQSPSTGVRVVSKHHLGAPPATGDRDPSRLRGWDRERAATIQQGEHVRGLAERPGQVDRPVAATPQADHGGRCRGGGAGLLHTSSMSVVDHADLSCCGTTSVRTIAVD